jgi:hypothetical protein
MRRLALVLTLACINACALPGTPPAVQREEVGNAPARTSRQMPAAMLERLGRYQNTRGARDSRGWTKAGCGLIVAPASPRPTRRIAYCQPLGMREQLTFYPRAGLRRVCLAAWRDGFVFAKDKGGDEFSQLYWFDNSPRASPPCSPTASAARTAARSGRDGGCWRTSTARNGTDTRHLGARHEHRRASARW